MLSIQTISVFVMDHKTPAASDMNIPSDLIDFEAGDLTAFTVTHSEHVWLRKQTERCFNSHTAQTFANQLWYSRVRVKSN